MTGETTTGTLARGHTAVRRADDLEAEYLGPEGKEKEKSEEHRQFVLTFVQPGLADAMYAPVCTRFVTYDVALEGKAAEYRDRIMAWSPMQQWIEDSKAEPIEIEELDIEF